MLHSITFRDANGANKRNTYDDWFLIPASRPVIAPPPPQTNIIQIPGTDGSRDLTELASGRPIFGDRSGSIQFYLEPGHWSWSEAYSTIANYLHSRRLSMILDDDPNYYYDGRYSVSQWQSDPHWETITINYVCAPYKLRTAYCGADWRWDDLHFVQNYRIADYENRLISDLSDEGGVTVIGYGMPTIPTIITTTNNVVLNLDGKTSVTLAKAGTHNAYNTSDLSKLAVSTGTHKLYVSGGGTNGRITVRYRGGSL